MYQAQQNEAPDLEGAATTGAPDESGVAELRRIDFTGTFWFAATIIAAGIPLGGLMAAGWRPSDLPPAVDAIWWAAAAIAAVGVAAFAWSGCPVLSWPVPVSDRQKRNTIRLGVVLYLVGAIVAGVCVLATPA